MSRLTSTAYDLADRHVTQILALLKVIGARGICVDPGKLAQFQIECDRQLAELQEKFNQDPLLKGLRPWTPKEGYKREPKDKTGLELMGTSRWARRKPFLATSTKQVLSYMSLKGHRIPLKKSHIVSEGEKRETSEQKALLLIWRKYKDDHYKDFVAFRKLKKLRGTYGAWKIRSDNRVVTRFTLRPDTGRLSSIAPNIQNIPKEGPLADLFRSCLIASPGHRLIRADLSSVEALLTGWFAKDPHYIRLAQLGIHKYAMAKYLGLPIDLSMSDDELRPILASIKERDPSLYRKIKICVYGSTYLAGPRKLFENNPEEFESQGDARKFQQFIKGLSNKISDWQQQTIRQAGLSKKLTNPFGYQKQFWDLPGGDGPAAIAFLPQSTTAAIMKEIMFQLWEKEAGQYMVWQIHDELVFDVPASRVTIVRDEIETAMMQPWPQLGGLSIGCEVRISEDMV